MMKKLTPLICLFIMVVMGGCQENEPLATAPESPGVVATATPSITPVPTRRATPTLIPPSPTLTPTLTKTAKPTATRTGTPTSTSAVPPDARMSFQCLEIAPTLPGDAASSGIVVLDSRVSVDGRYQPDTLLLNMVTGEATQLASQGERLSGFAISPDKKIIAFSSFLVDAEELAIATADGLRQKVIPWEEKWLDILGWTNDQRLLISYDEPVFASSDGHRNPISYLVLDPFSGERLILRPDFPRLLDLSPINWYGWYRTIYDPTLTRAIYPRFIGDNDEQYTYALWDVTNQQLVTTLEDIYTYYTDASLASPMPHWSPDGSQFVFRGHISGQEIFDLYRVSRDGQAERLTHLTSIAEINQWGLSWSPDGRYIAMIVSAWYANVENRVVVLDTETLDITDYCIPVRGIVPPAPIWSPDGSQFLVADQYEEGHQRVILVDIDLGFAAQIAEDMEPVGWMVAP